MLQRSAIILAARECIGTPFHHQGRLVGVGIDCVGVIAHIGARLGILLQDCAGYSRRPDGKTLMQYVRKSLVEKKSDGEPGDVVVFWVEKPNLPSHVGVLTETGIVHALFGQKCAEHRFPEPYWAARMYAVYAFPGVAPWQA